MALLSRRYQSSPDTSLANSRMEMREHAAGQT